MFNNDSLHKSLERYLKESEKREAERMAKWLEVDRNLVDLNPLTAEEEAAAEKHGFTPFEYRRWRNEQADDALFQGMREEIHEGEKDWRKAGAVVRGQERATQKRQEGRIEAGLYDRGNVRDIMVEHIATTGKKFGAVRDEIIEVIGKDPSFFRDDLSKKSILAAVEAYKKNN